jgi:ABC-2 type transport system ATP-binding protein
MIMSILFPDSGRMGVLGQGSALAAKDRIGYLPEERGLYKKMKVGAFLEYIAELKGQPRGDLRRRVQDWLERVGLPDVAGKRCEDLSKGMQQKVQFVAAVIHEPELLILDEPFSGLDPVSARLLRDVVLEQNVRGATSLFSTHIMTQAEQICDHVVMIHNGQKVLDDRIADIRARFDPRRVIAEPLGAAVESESFRGIAGVESVTRENGTYELTLRAPTDAAAVMRAALDAAPLARIELSRPTLEDIFIDTVVGADAGSGHEGLLRASLRDPSVSGGERR